MRDLLHIDAAIALLPTIWRAVSCVLVIMCVWGWEVFARVLLGGGWGAEVFARVLFLCKGGSVGGGGVCDSLPDRRESLFLTGEIPSASPRPKKVPLPNRKESLSPI